MPEEPHIVIAISRQLGAGGALLGQRLSARLGFAYLDREILRLAGERLGMSAEQLEHWDERVSRRWERVIDSFAIGPPEGIYSGFSAPPGFHCDELFELETRLMREFAQRRSAVVIGRAGAWVLQGHPGLVRIYLHAPAEWRARQLVEALGLKSEKEAMAMVQRIDPERERFVQAKTGRQMSDARNYDLAIRADMVGLDLAEELVAQLAQRVKERLGKGG